MSGHSKWHNIRLRKEAQDVRKGKIFGKAAREIIVAARDGGGNLEANPRLRDALEHARQVHMPAENIKRAIQRGTGQVEGVTYEESTLEAYGPGGVALMLHLLTDNRNRSLGEIRFTLNRHGGRLGEPNCVAWMFEPKGVVIVSPEMDEETVIEAALEAGAEDVTSDASGHEITTAPESLEAVKAALAERAITPESAEVTMLPQARVTLEGQPAHRILRLMEDLEEHDDVQHVYANFDIPDEVMQELAAA